MSLVSLCLEVTAVKREREREREKETNKHMHTNKQTNKRCRGRIVKLFALSSENIKQLSQQLGHEGANCKRILLL